MTLSPVWKSQHESFYSVTASGVSSSACYMSASSAMNYGEIQPFQMPGHDLFLPKQNILSEDKHRSLIRVMREHKEGLDLLAE